MKVLPYLGRGLLLVGFLQCWLMLRSPDAAWVREKKVADVYPSSKSVPCPRLNLSPQGRWEEDVTNGTQSWTWLEQDGETYRTMRNGAGSPPLTQHPVSSLLQQKNTSLVFYGSSHLREIYASLIRLEQNLAFDAKLPDTITYLPSGTRYRTKACDPTRRGWTTGLLGVDLVKCGLPGRRMVPELGERVAIGFKTFLHTPEADAQFLDFLTQHGLRQPDVLIVDVGIWGVRGDKMGGDTHYVLTPEEELDYYLNWIQTSFPSSRIIFLYEEAPPSLLIQPLILSKLENMTKPDVDVAVSPLLLLRKDYLLRHMPEKMPCGHGCAGPVTRTLSLLLLEWLAKSK